MSKSKDIMPASTSRLVCVNFANFETCGIATYNFWGTVKNSLSFNQPQSCMEIIFKSV